MLSNASASMVLFCAGYLSALVTVLAMVSGYRDNMTAAWSVLLIAVVFMSVMFFISRVLGRTDVVDIAWGLSFIAVAISSLLRNSYVHPIGSTIQTLTTILVTIWGLRLAFMIFKRLRTHPEDKRYVTLRARWKGSEPVNTYLRIFIVQAVLAFIISFAVLHINLSPPAPIGALAVIGTIIWVIGFVFEAVGDWQLKRFLMNSNNRGKLMTTGLWRYSRHPNYFGEATMWWGIFVIALSTQYGWLGVITPVVITYLLVYVSGVPLTEHASKDKPGWSTYQAKTSMFIPLPPKR